MTYRIAREPAGSSRWSDPDWIEWLHRDGRLVPIAGATHGQCLLCFGAVEGYPRCYPCNTEIRPHLSGLLAATYSTKSTFEPLVWGVKDNGQRWLLRPLGALLNDVMRRHLVHLETRFDPLDVLVPLPSHSETRDGFDHMREIVAPYAQTPWARGRLRSDALARVQRRREGRTVEPEIFAADPAIVRGRRIGVIDDTFTRGATLASAAATLSLAGARSVVGITLGRQLNPEYVPSQPLLAAQTRARYDISRCPHEAYINR